MTRPDLPPKTVRRLRRLRSTGRFDSLIPFWKHRTDPSTAKGWILPDGTAVSIGCWHYEWILANRERIAAVGARLAGIPPQEEPVRIAAVQGGCFRVNYDLRHGGLTIEGLESRFGGLVRDAVFVSVVESLDQIGTLRLILFDDTVTSVRHRLEVSLSSLGTSLERLRAVDGLLRSIPPETRPPPTDR